MTLIQKKAIDMIKQMPDDKIYYVVNILEGIAGLSAVTDNENRVEKSQEAYQKLQQFRKVSLTDRDYKAELAEALEEKYADIN